MLQKRILGSLESNSLGCFSMLSNFALGQVGSEGPPLGPEDRSNDSSKNSDGLLN